MLRALGRNRFLRVAKYLLRLDVERDDTEDALVLLDVDDLTEEVTSVLVSDTKDRWVCSPLEWSSL